MATLKYLPFKLWPEADRAAWAAAFVAGDIFDETQGPGAHLAPGSRRTLRVAYRRWLGFLAAHDPEALHLAPAARLTRQRLAAFVAVLQAEGAATTTAIAIHGLYLTMRITAPEHGWTWLGEIRSALTARARPADRFERLVPPWQVLDLGIGMMDGAVKTKDWTPETLRDYRDGLLLALLALWPIRRRSLAALTVTEHIMHQGDSFRLRLFPEDTKAKRSEEYVLDEILVPYLDRYLREVRPRFLAALDHDSLWASSRGSPLCADTLRQIVRRRTKAAFGKAMAVHDMRRAAATFLAIEAPEQVGIIPGVLQQASPEVGEQHYNLARSAAASRRFASHVTAFRKRRGPARRKSGG